MSRSRQEISSLLARRKVDNDAETSTTTTRGDQHSLVVGALLNLFFPYSYHLSFIEYYPHYRPKESRDASSRPSFAEKSPSAEK